MNGSKGWINKEKNRQGMKIDLGCGDLNGQEKRKEGYVLQDVDPTIPDLDLVCDIREVDKYIPEGQCSVIRLSHVLEHFGTNEVPVVLEKLYKILQNGGTLEIAVPNFEWHARLALDGNDKMAIYYAFGGQLDNWDYHKTGFTRAILFDRLYETGFTNIDIDNGTSLSCTCRK